MQPTPSMFIMCICIYTYIFVHYSTNKVIDNYFWVYKWHACACMCVCRKTEMKYSKTLMVVLGRQWNSRGCLFSSIFSKLPQCICYFYIPKILLLICGLKNLMAILPGVFQWCKLSVLRYFLPCLVSSRIHGFGARIIWIQIPPLF